MVTQTGADGRYRCRGEARLRGFVSNCASQPVGSDDVSVGSCDTEASSAYRRRPTVRVMKEGPSGSAIMS
jgi:hypothetical protein